MKTKCKCGSEKFRTSIDLRIRDIPVSIEDGKVKYDDSKGVSEGWDIREQPEINCDYCLSTYRIEPAETPIVTDNDDEDHDPTGEERYTIVDLESRGYTHG